MKLARVAQFSNQIRDPVHPPPFATIEVWTGSRDLFHSPVPTAIWWSCANARKHGVRKDLFCPQQLGSSSSNTQRYSLIRRERRTEDYHEDPICADGPKRLATDGFERQYLNIVLCTSHPRYRPSRAMQRSYPAAAGENRTTEWEENDRSNGTRGIRGHADRRGAGVAAKADVTVRRGNKVQQNRSIYF